MWRSWIIALLLVLAMPLANAQKYACVNTDYVLRNIPDYADAQKKLDKLVEEWRQELEDMQAELDRMRAEYEQESFLLPDNLKKHRQEDIRRKEQELRELQQKHFGPGGDLEKRRTELMRPIQDKVYSAIERIAQEKSYAFVFDRAGSATVLFASKKYDISDEVLESLGYRPNMVQESTADTQQKSQTKKVKAPSNPEMITPLSGRK